LTIIAALLLSAVSVAVGMQVHAWLYRLPDPATADREGLVRWLVIADLTDRDDATCRALVDRCEVVFADEGQLPSDTQTLDERQLARVKRNVERLKEVWFHARVDDYLALPPDEQPAFLDRQIRNVFRCAELDRRLDDGDGGSGDDHNGEHESAEDVGGYVAAFFQTLTQWQAAAPRTKQAQIDDVVQAGLIRWLSTHDLSRQPAAVRRSVVAGLEKALGDELSFGDATSSLAAAESERFWKNVEVLAESWFHAKSEEFAALADERRAAFVVRQLAVVEELSSHWPSASQSAAADTAARLQRWIASASAGHRAAAGDFAVALQKAWFARAFGSLLRGV
jgi:hypothetical protein